MRTPIKSGRCILVGTDRVLQPLLPWWWKHYSLHCQDPVVFVDFGMTEEAKNWCRRHGELIVLPPNDLVLSSEETIPREIGQQWNARYGEGIWLMRGAWMKKPFALLACPYEFGLWLDIDCKVKGSLDPLFSGLGLGFEIALARDIALEYARLHGNDCHGGEIQYNSGVVAFRADAPILHQWVEAVRRFEQELPGDQQFLSRAIHLHRPNLLELPLTYNWTLSDPPFPITIRHYTGGGGRREICASEEFLSCERIYTASSSIVPFGCL